MCYPYLEKDIIEAFDITDEELANQGVIRVNDWEDIKKILLNNNI